MLEQINKTILEISILVSGLGLGLNSATKKLRRGRTAEKLFKQSEKSKQNLNLPI